MKPTKPADGNEFSILSKITFLTFLVNHHGVTLIETNHDAGGHAVANGFSRQRKGCLP